MYFSSAGVLTQPISKIVPFHDRKARSISPSAEVRRPSESCINPACAIGVCRYLRSSLAEAGEGAIVIQVLNLRFFEPGARRRDRLSDADLTTGPT